MKAINFIILSTLMLITCGLQENKISIGDYYNLGNIGLKVQFPDNPVTSKVLENEILKSVEYRFSFNRPEDDINYFYAVAVYTINKEDINRDLDKRIEFIAKVTVKAFELVPENIIESTEKSSFKGSSCIKIKAKIFYPFLNKLVASNSIIFNYKNYVIRAYVNAAVEKDGNSKMKYFFDSIKLE